MSAIQEDGYRPGAMAELIRLQLQACRDAYGRDRSPLRGRMGPDWSSGAFEARLTLEIGRFFERFDPERDYFYGLWRDEKLLGAMALDADAAGEGAYAGAHVRWFVVSLSLSGSGVERHFLSKAVRLAMERRYPRLWLETFAGTGPRAALCERFGFRRVREAPAPEVSAKAVLQRWEARRPFERAPADPSAAD